MTCQEADVGPSRVCANERLCDNFRTSPNPNVLSCKRYCNDKVNGDQVCPIEERAQSWTKRLSDFSKLVFNFR